MKPIITIGMCVRNCEKVIDNAINSIMIQDFPHNSMELIFVDDGSTDKTLAILQDYVSRIDIRTLLLHTEWRGLGPARQLIVRNANGKYILWVDGDEALSTNYVRKQVDFMENNPRVAVTGGIMSIDDATNMLINLELVRFNIDHLLFEKPRSFLWKTVKLPGTGGSTFRMDALQEVKGFDESIRGSGEDMDIVKRIELAGWSIKLNEAVFYEKKGEMMTLSDLWSKYFWYGFGSYGSYLRNRATFLLPRMTPLAGFLTGFFYSVLAYKLMRKKIYFLLPFLFFFKMTAWCLGFAKSQITNASYPKFSSI